MLGKAFKKQEIKVKQKLEMQGQKIIKTSIGANFFGVKSKRFKQIRGNGVLILTDKMLFFQLLLPKKEFTINFNSIKNIELVKSFLGKIRFNRKLLKIDFINESGNNDSIAFDLKDVEAFEMTLKSLIGI